MNTHQQILINMSINHQAEKQTINDKLSFEKNVIERYHLYKEIHKLIKEMEDDTI